ncbi:hypothetical protein PQ459_14175 [Chryseobacterium sp. KACC 21268]|nr:hypothetical protein PQ459_14175 [Chryseobacterium sp. KACC 21268]
MKNIILCLFTAVSNVLFSQVIIGDNVGTATNKTSVLMEFSSTQRKGIILPYLTDISDVNTPGSIFLRISNPTTAPIAKIVYYDYDGTFKDLSPEASGIGAKLKLNIQPILKENSNSKVIIGDESSTANGILVLESKTKAMVLPTVSSYKEIVNPAPGMMVLTGVGEKTLAFFNGSKWSFWSY